MKNHKNGKNGNGFKTISSSSQGYTYHLDDQEYMWATKEAKRRGVPRSQIVRDGFRAYRKLEKTAVPYTCPLSKKVKEVSF